MVKVALLDLTVERGDDFFLAGKEVRPRQVHAGDCMVGDKGAVAGEIFNEKLKLLQHLFFGKRREFAAFSFFKKRRAGEERQPARADEHGLALAENLRRVDGVLPAVFFSGDAVEEGHPVWAPWA